MISSLDSFVEVESSSFAFPDGIRPEHEKYLTPRLDKNSIVSL